MQFFLFSEFEPSIFQEDEEKAKGNTHRNSKSKPPTTKEPKKPDTTANPPANLKTTPAKPKELAENENITQRPQPSGNVPDDRKKPKGGACRCLIF